MRNVQSFLGAPETNTKINKQKLIKKFLSILRTNANRLIILTNIKWRALSSHSYCLQPTRGQPLPVSLLVCLSVCSSALLPVLFTWSFCQRRNSWFYCWYSLAIAIWVHLAKNELRSKNVLRINSSHLELRLSMKVNVSNALLREKCFKFKAQYWAVPLFLSVYISVL